MDTRARPRQPRPSGVSAADYQVLERLPLFAGLSRDNLEHLLADAWVHGFARGSVLFIQEDPAERFFVIFDGWVKLFRATAEGDESVISIFTRGESFAEAAIFDKGVYPVSAATVSESRLLVIPAESFMRRLRENGGYALNMMASMSRHLRSLVRQIEQLSARSSTERLAGFLLRLCKDEDKTAVVRLPLEKALIAGRLGMQPETLSRSLKKLQRLGVSSTRGEVVIADVAALRAFSEGEDREGL